MHGKFQCPLGLELLLRNLLHITEGLKFQCPLGLIPHFYSRIPSLRSKIPRCFNALSGLYLISTLVECMDRTCVKEVSMPFRAYTSFLLTLGSDEVVVFTLCFNALSGLYLISTMNDKDVRLLIREVSMPSRAYTSFLQYPFKNLGFMRFPEPVFAGIYQNILTTAVFRAC